MKIVFVASKYALIYENEIRRYASKDDEIIINRADAIDFISAERLRSNGYKISEYSPDYERYGKAAPEKIVDGTDKIIFVDNGASQLTQRIMAYADEKGVPQELILRPLVIKLH